MENVISQVLYLYVCQRESVTQRPLFLDKSKLVQGNFVLYYPHGFRHHGFLTCSSTRHRCIELSRSWNGWRKAGRHLIRLRYRRHIELVQIWRLFGFLILNQRWWVDNCWWSDGCWLRYCWLYRTTKVRRRTGRGEVGINHLFNKLSN